MSTPQYTDQMEGHELKAVDRDHNVLTIKYTSKKDGEPLSDMPFEYTLHVTDSVLRDLHESLATYLDTEDEA